MPKFVQLNKEDCAYLLELIQDMDSETKYTERQRGYTVPKLHKILDDPNSARLAYQDVEYLLDLMDDDDLEETQEQKELTKSAVLEIQFLMNSHFEETRDSDVQRASRRLKRANSTDRRIK